MYEQVVIIFVLFKFHTHTHTMEQGGKSLSGKRVAKVKIKSDGDVFHELWKSLQLQIPSLTPTTFKNCQTLGGQVGIVGCVLVWNYFLGNANIYFLIYLHLLL